MFTFETTDLKEVRRFRIAQFNGRPATARSGDRIVTGLVRSVLEHASAVPSRWTITLVAAPEKPRPVVLRPGPRIDRFAEDYF